MYKKCDCVGCVARARALETVHLQGIGDDVKLKTCTRHHQALYKENTIMVGKFKVPFTVIHQELLS